MVYLISYKMVLQKVGAWGLRPRQVGVKGDAALGGGIPNPLLALPEWLATEAGKHIATAEAGIREGAGSCHCPRIRQGSTISKTDRDMVKMA